MSTDDVLQHMKRQEAEQQRVMDEESLRKQMNAKRAKEQAEQLHQVRPHKKLVFSYC